MVYKPTYNWGAPSCTTHMLIWVIFRAHVGRYSTHGAFQRNSWDMLGFKWQKWVTNKVSDFTLKHDEHGDHGKHG